MANDFLPFASAGGANVMTQAAYAGLAARTAGFSAGTAQSIQLNKVWRQSSLMATVLAQTISDITGADSVDDGTTNTLIANFKKAMNLSSQVPIGGSDAMRASVSTAGSSATFTDDQVIVKNSLSGFPILLSSFSKTINLAGAVGVGGMDIGAAPVNGYVGIYAIYNPTTQVSGLLAVNANVVLAQVYGGANMPAGYTASALLAVWPTNASSQFRRGLLQRRKLTLDAISILSTSTQQAAFLNFSLAAYIPINAKRIWGVMTGQSTVVTAVNTYIAADNLGLGAVYGGGGSTGSTSSFNIDLVTPQQAAYSFTVTAGSPTMNYYLNAYEI